MDWKTYLTAPCGRIAAATAAWLVAAAAILALFGPGAYVTTFLPVAVLLAIVGSIFAVGLAITDFGMHALALVIALPLLGGPYLAALHIAPNLDRSVGAFLLLFAGAAGALALWGPRSLSASRKQTEGPTGVALQEEHHARP